MGGIVVGVGASTMCSHSNSNPSVFSCMVFIKCSVRITSALKLNQDPR